MKGMNSDNNPFPDYLLADLYKNSLVIVNENIKHTINTPIEPEKPSQEKEWYLGNNLQKITLLVREKEAVYLTDESLQFLSSILGACQLNLGDVAVINYQNDPVSFGFVKEKLTPRFVLLFGVSAPEIQLPFTVPHYQVQQHANCSFLLAPALNKLIGDSKEAKLEKSKLWLCLKKMFNI